MMLTTSALAIALSLAMSTAAMAQPATPSLDARGTIVRVDRPHNVVLLDDGRMYRLTSTSVVLVNNQIASPEVLQPGAVVMLRSAEVVTVRNGQYVVAGPAETAVVTSPPAPVVVAPLPPPAPVAAAPASVPAAVPTVKATIHGTVTDVDRDGEVKVKTEKGSFEMRLTPDAARRIRKGDAVVIDTSFAPPGTQIR
jgi:hypothetical protein